MLDLFTQVESISRTNDPLVFLAFGTDDFHTVLQIVPILFSPKPILGVVN